MAQEMGFFLSHARVSSKKHKGIKSDDIFNLFQQLSTMIQAGMPLMDAIVLSGSQSQSTRLGRVMDQIATKVQAGTALYVAMNDSPHIFECATIPVLR